MVSRNFLVFVLIGGFSSVVNVTARILIDRFVSYELAITLAFVIGVTSAFLLNRLFVFKPIPTAVGGQFFRFLVVNLATLVQVIALSALFARLIFPATGMRYHPYTIAHGIGLVSPLFTSYWAHKHFTFRASGDGGERLQAR